MCWLFGSWLSSGMEQRMEIARCWYWPAFRWPRCRDFVHKSGTATELVTGEATTFDEGRHGGVSPTQAMARPQKIHRQPGLSQSVNLPTAPSPELPPERKTKRRQSVVLGASRICQQGLQSVPGDRRDLSQSGGMPRAGNTRQSHPREPPALLLHSQPQTSQRPAQAIRKTG